MFKISVRRYIKEARAEETRRLEVDQDKVRIGSGTGNDVCLEGAGVDIDHAVIEKTGEGAYRISDLESSDGTFLNNDPVEKSAELSDGDVLRIGLYNFVFKPPASAGEPAEIEITETFTEEDDSEEAAAPPPPDVKYVSKFRLYGPLLSVRTLSAAAAVILIVLSYYWFTEEDKAAYSPGPLSSAHTQFNNECAKCHTVSWDIVPDDACLSCHEVNQHNMNENFTPPCVDCHVEHHGNTVLADIQDAKCTVCHADLVTINFAPSDLYERHIEGFESGHPEFAVLVPGADGEPDRRIRLSDDRVTDKTPIYLNHKLHLNPKDKTSFTEELKCESCHVVDDKGEYTGPINYEKHCQRCHTLEFDIRFGDLEVPHGPSDDVVEFMRKTYTTYAVEKNIGDVRNWASLRVKETSGNLFRNKCGECHVFEETKNFGDVPQVIEPVIPARWLPHGQFDHDLHVETLRMECADCHKAEESERTTDVLMPSINDCLECHSSGGGAVTDCVLCHEYHEREVDMTMQKSE